MFLIQLPFVCRLVMFTGLLCIAPLLQTKAQSLSGQLNTAAAEPVAGATVRLMRAKDSTLAKLAVTDNRGRFVFAQLQEGNYFLAVSHIGFQPYFSPQLAITNATQAEQQVTLNRQIQQTGDVTVLGRKPLLEIKPDRQVLNVEAGINAIGSDALDLLRKSPGILVDQGNNISMSGKTGTLIYIDGKASPLSGKLLTDYLAALPSALIESIEIITNPPARYDAAGNAGIINIRLKKDRSLGTNSSVLLGYAIGVYRKLNGTITLNNRTKNYNFFASYSLNNTHNKTTLHMQRYLSDTLYNQFGTNDLRSENHLFKTAADFYLDKKNTLGLVLNGSLISQQNGSDTKTPFVYLPTNTAARQLNAGNDNNITRKDLGVNINYRRLLPKNSEWTIDADYGLFRIQSDQLQPNIYLNPVNGTEISRNSYAFEAPTDIDYFSGKTDFDIALKKGKLGFGLKASRVLADNHFAQYRMNGSVKTADSSQINDFTYKENIQAAYLNYSRAIKKINLQLGLRLERTAFNTVSTGYNKNAGTYFSSRSENKVRFIDLFPNLNLVYTANSKNSFGINASRRIDRAPYQDLNPFEVKIDEYTYYKGNPGLQPQYTTAAGLFYTYNKRLTLRAGFSRVNQVFAKLVDTIYTVRSFQINKNLASQQIASLSLIYQYSHKWYTLNFSANGFRTRYQANFGAGRQVDLKVNTLQLNFQQYANLGRDVSAELTGFYTSPSLWSGTFRTKELYAIDLGVQKKIMKGNGTVKISVSDVFKTLWWRGRSVFASQETISTYRWEARQFKLSLSLRLGNNQLKAMRQKSSSVDEESKRVKTSQGSLTN